MEGPEGFRSLVKRAKLRLLRMHHEAGVGHIGGNLSALDVLLHLHHRTMGPDDVFVLSKGHAAGALYVTLWTTGKLTDEDLESFHAEGTHLAGHPPPRWIPEIPIATGSLGHGFPAAAGMALAMRLAGQSGRVFCLTSDGEWQEGATWEALVFANHHRLENLTVLVDANRLQGFGGTAEVASMEDLAGRLRAFVPEVHVVDGHDPDALAAGVRPDTNGLQVVVLDTVKGHGVSFMEGRMEWHYLPLDDEELARATREVEAG